MPRRYQEITLPPADPNLNNDDPNDPRRFFTRLKAEIISDETNKLPIIAVFEQEHNRGYKPDQVRSGIVADLSRQFNIAPDSMRYMEHDREGELRGGIAFNEWIFRLDGSGALFQDKNAITHTREQYERLAETYGREYLEEKAPAKYSFSEDLREIAEEANVAGADRPDSGPRNETENDYEPEM